MNFTSESLFDHPDISCSNLHLACALDSLDIEAFCNELNVTTGTGQDTSPPQSCMNNPLLWRHSDLAEHNLKHSASRRDHQPQTVELANRETDWSYRLLQDDPETALADTDGSSWQVPDLVDNTAQTPFSMPSLPFATSHEHCETCVCGSLSRLQQESNEPQLPLIDCNPPWLDFLEFDHESSDTLVKARTMEGLLPKSVESRVCDSSMSTSESSMGSVMNLALDDLVDAQPIVPQTQEYETSSSNGSSNATSEPSGMAVCPSQTTSPSMYNDALTDNLSDWWHHSTPVTPSSSSNTSPSLSGRVYQTGGRRESLHYNGLPPTCNPMVLPVGNPSSSSHLPPMPGHSSAPLRATRPLLHNMTDIAMSSNPNRSCASRSDNRKRSFDTMAATETHAIVPEMSDNSNPPQAKRVMPADYDILTAKRETLTKEVVEPIRKGGLYGVPSKLINGWAYATKQWMYTELYGDKVRGKKLFRPGFRQMHIDDLRELVKHCRSGLPWQNKVISLGHLTVEQRNYFNLH